MIAAVTAADAVTDDDAARQSGDGAIAVGRRGRAAVVQLMFRTAIVRIISLGGTAVLARMLLPEDFGTFAVVAFVVSLVGPLADFGLGPALVQQRERPSDEEMGTVITLQLAFALTLTAGIWLLAPLARAVAPGLPPDIEWMIRVTSLILPLIAFRALPGAMMSRVLRFGPLAAIEVVQQVVYFVTAIWLALQGAGAWSFIWALVAHTAVGAVLVNLAWGGRFHIGFNRAIARRMLGFGLPFQATGILVTSREALVPVFGGLSGGLAAIGYLQFGVRLGRLAGSVDDIIGRVAFPAFSRLQGDTRRLNRALVSAVETTALMLAATLAWAVAVAPTLVPLVFSGKWAPAVGVFQFVAIATLALVPGNFVRGLGFAVGKGREMFAWSVATTVLVVILFPVLLVWFGVAGGGLALAIYSFIQLAAYGYATRQVAQFPWWQMLRIYGLAAVAAAGSAVVNALLGGVVGLVASGLVFLLLFGLLLVALERDQLRRAWRLIRGELA
jgi:O-antigen/teichoic acid export membrane protein